MTGMKLNAMKKVAGMKPDAMKTTAMQPRMKPSKRWLKSASGSLSTAQMCRQRGRRNGDYGRGRREDTVDVPAPAGIAAACLPRCANVEQISPTEHWTLGKLQQTAPGA